MEKEMLAMEKEMLAFVNAFTEDKYWMFWTTETPFESVFESVREFQVIR